MPRTRIAGWVLAALLLSACAQLSGSAAGPAAATHDRLVVAFTGQVGVIDGASGSVVKRIDGDLLSPDARRVYQRSADQLIVRDLSGAEIARVTVPRALAFPSVTYFGRRGGLSPSGRYLTLTGGDYEGKRVLRSHFLVYDSTALDQPPRSADLEGRYQFDAIADDGRTLYLLQYPAQADDPTYQVRSFDLLVGRLNPWAVADKSRQEEPMLGERLASVLSPGGSFLYSAYSRPDGGAFIHVLPLVTNGQTARCIDLPGQGVGPGGLETGWSLALDHPGNRLFAVNPRIRLVAQVDLSSGTVSKTLTVSLLNAPHGLVTTAEAKEDLARPAVLTPEGRIYFPSFINGIIVVDARHLTQLSTLASGQDVNDLILSPEGRWLWALTSGGRLLRFDAASGAQVSAVSSPWRPNRLLAIT